jgi:hypothetical protein
LPDAPRSTGAERYSRATPSPDRARADSATPVAHPGREGARLDEHTFVAPAPLTVAMSVKQRFQREHGRLNCLAGWKRGRMLIRFEFDGSGRFMRPEILEDTMDSPKLTACIRKALAALDGVVMSPEVASRSFVQTLSPPHGNPVVER